MKFEVHITGEGSFLEICKQIGLRTIELDLLKPDYSILRREEMVSEIIDGDYAVCYIKVLFSAEIIKKLGGIVSRVKIESPPNSMFKDSALYVESHFKINDNKYPISRNINKDYYLGTDREYDPNKFDEFINKHKDHELEFCLYDDHISGDQDWLGLWGK